MTPIVAARPQARQCARHSEWGATTPTLIRSGLSTLGTRAATATVQLDVKLEVVDEKDGIDRELKLLVEARNRVRLATTLCLTVDTHRFPSARRVGGGRKSVEGRSLPLAAGPHTTATRHDTAPRPLAERHRVAEARVLGRTLRARLVR